MRFFFILCACLCSFVVHAQTRSDSTVVKMLIDSVNRGLDHAVVKKDTAFLERHYADDFRFFHATGLIDSKRSWINGVKKNQMLSRTHDSVMVEWHGDLALVTGTLTVRFPKASGRTGYAVRYIRVYALRGKYWQLVSHHSTAEWDVVEQ